MGSWPIQLARHVQDQGCCWHHGALSPDDLSSPISAQWERDPVILQATATHWRYGCVKCSGYASQCMVGHYHVGKSQCYVGQRAFNRAAYSLFLAVLSQTLVPVAFLTKRHNFRLDRNLLRRDEVMRKRSSRGVVLRGLPDLGRSATFPVCWNLFSSRLIADSWRWKCRATSLADMPDGSLMLLKRHSRPTWNDVWHRFSKIFYFQFLCLR